MVFSISNSRSSVALRADSAFEKLETGSVQVSSKQHAKIQDRKPSSDPSVEGHRKQRYELSNLNQESVSIQKKISRAQASLLSLDRLKEELVSIRKRPEDQVATKKSLDKAMEIIRSSSFDEKQIFGTTKNTSTSENIEAITVERPPQIGVYSISVLRSKANENLVTLTLKSEENPKYEKSIETSIGHTSGLIRGIEIFFEQVKDQESAKLEVKDRMSDDFPVPSFENSLKFLMDHLDQRHNLLKGIDLSLRKVEITRFGIEKNIEEYMNKLSKVQQTQEYNLEASDSSANIEDIKTALSRVNHNFLKKPDSASDVFFNQKPARVTLDLIP